MHANDHGCGGLPLRQMSLLSNGSARPKGDDPSPRPSPKHAAKVVVCVCTFQRPLMLRRCLESLGGQVVPADVGLQLVVVDNSPDAGARTIVAQHCLQLPFQLHYVHEPRRGISHARNAAIRAALELEPTWLAMFDDDQVVEPECLAEALAAAKRYRADVVSCHLKPVFPSPMPFWADPSFHAETLDDGQSMQRCGTGGVLCSSWLFEGEGLGLRFDDRYGLMGGEDSKLFYQASSRGARIVASARAIVREDIGAERSTFGWQFKRHFINTVANACIARDLGQGKSASKRLRRALRGMLSVLIETPLLPVYAGVSRRLFRKRMLRMGRKVSGAAGTVAELWGARPQQYLTTHGR